MLSTAANVQAAVLAVEKLVTSYGRIEALHGIDMTVPAGQLVCLLGANGAGKTTLLKTVSGVIRSDSGTVRMFGRDVTRAASNHRCKDGLALVPEGRHVFGPLSVEDN